MLKVMCFVVMLGLSGCAGSIVEIEGRTGKELESSATRELVSAYGQGRHPRIRGELERRGTFTGKEWEAIDARTINLGMREEAVWASWGWPHETHSLTTASGTSRTLYYARQHVYLTNGVVTAIGQ